MPVEENSVIEDFERVIHGYFNGIFTEKELLSMHLTAIEFVADYCKGLAKLGRSVLMIAPFSKLKVNSYSETKISLGFGLFDSDTAREICSDTKNPIRKYVLCIYKYLVHLRLGEHANLAEADQSEIDRLLKPDTPSIDMGYNRRNDVLGITDIVDFYTDVICYLNDDSDFSQRSDRIPPYFIVKCDSQPWLYTINANGVSKKQRRSGYSKEEIEKYKATTKEPDQDFIKYFSKFYA